MSSCAIAVSSAKCQLLGYPHDMIKGSGIVGLRVTGDVLAALSPNVTYTILHYLDLFIDMNNIAFLIWKFNVFLYISYEDPFVKIPSNTSAVLPGG